MRRSVGLVSSLAAWAGALLATLVVAPACAQEAPRNQVSFQVGAGREVPNDRVQAVLVASAEAKEAADSAAQVNRAMSWALSRAKGKTGISVRTSSYSTQPIYARAASSASGERPVTSWRTRQHLVLSGADAEQVAGMASELQERLSMESFTFSVSDERRRAVEDELIAEALEDFRERADLVRRSLDARSFEIARVDIDTGGVHPYARARVAPQMVMEEGGVAAEAGSSRVEVRVNATITLD